MTNETEQIRCSDDDCGGYACKHIKFQIAQELAKKDELLKIAEEKLYQASMELIKRDEMLKVIGKAAYEVCQAMDEKYGKDSNVWPEVVALRLAIDELEKK
jgi:hypothetical protein